jgi:hypothetical protein
MAMEITTDAVQALGRPRHTKDWPVERYMRDAKITRRSMRGTNQVQRIVMAKQAPPVGQLDSKSGAGGGGARQRPADEIPVDVPVRQAERPMFHRPWVLPTTETGVRRRTRWPCWRRRRTALPDQPCWPR